MERQIGETFSYNGTKLEVVEQSLENKDTENACNGCYFKSNFMVLCYKNNEITGECSCIRRTDKKDVIFKEIKK